MKKVERKRERETEVKSMVRKEEPTPLTEKADDINLMCVASNAEPEAVANFPSPCFHAVLSSMRQFYLSQVLALTQYLRPKEKRPTIQIPQTI